MNPFVIQTERLTRYFGARCAVDQVTLAVPRGTVFALLGRNGSGKTTLVRMLLGMLEPTRGHASILGDDIRNIRPVTRGKIGYIAEGHPLIDWMRVKDLQQFQKSFYPTWDGHLFQTVIDHFGLSGTARARHLSRGQRAGLSLALVLATRPELLVMDDPALGLDLPANAQPNYPDHPSRDAWVRAGVFAFSPPAFFLAVYLIRSYQWHGFTWQPMLGFATVAAVFAVIGFWRLRVRHIGGWRIWTWTLLAATIGFAGLLVIPSLLGSVPAVACRSCGKRRFATEAGCPNCGTVAEPPAMRGIEILDL